MISLRSVFKQAKNEPIYVILFFSAERLRDRVRGGGSEGGRKGEKTETETEIEYRECKTETERQRQIEYREYNHSNILRQYNSEILVSLQHQCILLYDL